MIQVAVMGYGTIGSGVVEVLETNREIIKRIPLTLLQRPACLPVNR